MFNAKEINFLNQIQHGVVKASKLKNLEKLFVYWNSVQRGKLL